MDNWTNNNKSAAGTFLNFLKHNSDIDHLSELANYTFETVVFSDGTKLKDLTFEQLAVLTWTNVTRN